MGSVSEFNKSYAHGEIFNIKAEANKHFKFSGWNLSKLHTFDVSNGNSSVRSQENVLLIDNLETPEIPLARGHTYNFVVSLPSNIEFFISSNSPVSTSFDHEYLLGIQNSRVSNGTLVFNVPENAPDYLYYTTSSNSVTGGKFKIITLDESDIITFPKEASISPTSLLDFEIVASFVDEEYKVNVSSDTGGSVDVVSSNFKHQDIVNLKATPDEHFEFVRWEGSELIENKHSPNSKLTVVEATNIKAVFTPKLYPLNISSAPTNTASFITSNNKLNFAFGETVEIQAIPKSGFKFLEWIGDINSSNSSTQIVMNGPQSIVAKIATQPVIIDLSGRSLNYLGEIDSNLIGGNVEGPSIIQKNQLATFSAEPREGFEFLGWFDEDNKTVASTLNTTLAFLNDSVITAVFREKSHELKVDIQPKYFGTLEWEDDFSLEQINTRLPFGYQVEITANPLNHNRFDKWFFNSKEKIDINENNISFIIRDDTSISAKFLAAPLPSLTIKMNPTGAGKVVGSGQRSTNGTHYIFASANDGYEFLKWEGVGIKSPNEETTSISFETNTVITAVFSKEENNGGDDGDTGNHNLLSLSVSPSNPNHGQTNPSSKNYYARGKVPILAKPKPGYIFSHWEGESIADPLSSSTEVNLESDLLIAAIFEATSNNQKQINVTHVIETLDYLGNQTKNENIGGTILGGTSFLNDYTPTFKAYPKEGYHFLRWENGLGQILSTSEEITYKSPFDFVLKAIFQRKAYDVRVFTQPGDKSEILWEGFGKSSQHTRIVPHGEQILLTALQGTSYQFLNWQTDGSIIRNPQELKINHTVKSETNFTAVYFPLNQVVITPSIHPERGGWILGEGKYSYNPKHPIHAKANNGFKFVRWEGSQINDPTSPQTTVNLDRNLDIKAIFEPDLLYEGDPTTTPPGLHVVEILLANPDHGTVQGTGVYGPGWIDIGAVANYGFEFSHWDSLAVADRKAAKTKLLVEDHSTATAYFKEKTLVIDSISEGNSGFPIIGLEIIGMNQVLLGHII